MQMPFFPVGTMQVQNFTPPPQIHLSKQFHLQVLNISFAKGKNGSFGLSKK